MEFFVLSLFALDVLDEIWDVTESVSEGFLTYSCSRCNHVFSDFKKAFDRVWHAALWSQYQCCHPLSSTFFLNGSCLMPWKMVGWLVGCFGLNGPLRQYFSLYQAVSQREGERKEKP